VIALLAGLWLQLGAARASLADVEFRGPCERVVAEVPGAGSVEVVFEPRLAEGEQRTPRLAVPRPAEQVPGDAWSRALADAFAATGRARLVAELPPADLSAVDPSLLARPRPQLELRGSGRPGGRASWSVLFVLGAAFAITLSRRRSPVVTTAIALAACLSTFVLTSVATVLRPREFTVYEALLGRDGGAPWLEVQAARGAFGEPDLVRGRIEIAPPDARVRCVHRTLFEFDAVESRGAAVYQLRPFDPGTRRLAREVNALADFDAVWFREAGEPWRRLGPWLLGDPLPRGEPGDPPGRLVPSLPMGTSILLGRFADSGALAAPGESRSPETWVRGLGL
jgi:hypothetical protein